MLFKGTYWLYFEYYVYIRVIKDQVLLLNTLDFSKIISNDFRLLSLFKEISNDDNIGLVEIDFDNEFSDLKYQQFFAEIRVKFMGDLVPKQLNSIPPVQLPSSIKLLNDVKKNGISKFLNYDDCRNNLISLNIYLNSNCANNCMDCCNYYKQILSCTKYVEGDFISIDLIKSIFENVSYDNLSRVNLLGGDISIYDNLEKLLEYMYPYKKKCHTIVNYFNMQNISNAMIHFFENRLYILVDISSIKNKLPVDFLEELYSYNTIFIVRDNDDLHFLYGILDDTIQNYSIIPLLSSDNISFFEENVYISSEDLFGELQSLKQIHRNQILNALSYGELFVYPNGDVYSNINSSKLGNLKEMSILNIISSELLNENSTWFKTRRKTTCSKCLYADLCPPISNYELFLNRFNFCTICSD